MGARNREFVCPTKPVSNRPLAPFSPHLTFLSPALICPPLTFVPSLNPALSFRSQPRKRSPPPSFVRGGGGLDRTNMAGCPKGSISRQVYIQRKMERQLKALILRYSMFATNDRKPQPMALVSIPFYFPQSFWLEFRWFSENVKL